MLRSPRRPGDSTRDNVSLFNTGSSRPPNQSLLLILVLSQIILGSILLYLGTSASQGLNQRVEVGGADTNELKRGLHSLSAALDAVREEQLFHRKLLLKCVATDTTQSPKLEPHPESAQPKETLEKLDKIVGQLNTQETLLDQMETLLNNLDYEQHQCRTRCEELLHDVVETTARIESRRAKLCLWGEKNQVLDEADPFPHAHMRWDDGSRNTSNHLTEVPRSSRILFISAIFGSGASRPYLQFFLKTAATSGIDFLLFGDPPLPFDLPSNVQHVHITWDELVNRVELMVFGGRPLDEMRKASVYKVIDVKPLYGLLFQRFLGGYDFWAYGDSDMLIGNVSRFVNSTLLDNYDVLCGIPPDKKAPWKRTWGPLTIMRNTPSVNELFKRTPGLYHIFNTQYAHFFDEWGGEQLEWYNASMSARVNEQIKAGELRWYGGFPHGWDGGCVKQSDPSCGECRFRNHPTFGNSLSWNRTLIKGVKFPPNTPRVIDVILCHFQHGKTRANEVLTKLGLVESVLYVANAAGAVCAWFNLTSESRLKRSPEFFQSHGKGFYTKRRRIPKARKKQ